MGDGRCPECNAKLIVVVVDGEHIIRCTSCDYTTTLQEVQKELPTDTTIMSTQEVMAAIAEFNGKGGVAADLHTNAVTLCNCLAINNTACVLDNVAEVLFAIDQIKILYSLSDEDIEKAKRYKIKRTLERNGIL